MKVLLLMISYPDTSQSSNLYTDLVDAFAAGNHEILVVAPAAPGRETAMVRENGKEVLRVKTHKLFNVHPVKKGIANVLLPGQFLKAIRRFCAGRKFDLIITPTPPITFVDVVARLKKEYQAKSYLILRDIFPQNAKDLGLINNTLLFNYFRRKEAKLYRTADHIGCLSPGNIAYVKKHNPEVDTRKLHLLPNWQKVDQFEQPIPGIKEKYGLKDKFIAIFGGNIGLPQKMENIVSLASCYRDRKDIIFFIIGSGTHKAHLEQLVQSAGLSNVIVRETIPRNEYNELVRQADIGLISLSEKFTIPNIPSKVLSYFNAKIPVLAAVDAATDFGEMLTEAGGGLCSITGDLDTYRKNFETLYESAALRKQMGESGYRYLVEKLTPEIAYQTIINRLNGQ